MDMIFEVFRVLWTVFVGLSVVMMASVLGLIVLAYLRCKEER